MKYKLHPELGAAVFRIAAFTVTVDLPLELPSEMLSPWQNAPQRRVGACAGAASVALPSCSAFCLAEKPELDEITLERVLEELETMCYENMNIAIETEEGLGIEYDEDVVCDVCRSPEGEDGNEMVFCDKCNVCVHQVSPGCRGSGSAWLCSSHSGTLLLWVPPIPTQPLPWAALGSH